MKIRRMVFKQSLEDFHPGFERKEIREIFLL